MRGIIGTVALGLALIAGAAQAQTYVQGYTKADGTYVAPYYRSSPNSTTSDNYSTKGNVNPYTGTPGTKADTRPSYGYVPPAPAAPTYQPYTYTPPAQPAPAQTRGGILTRAPDALTNPGLAF